jgi:bifunctional non-homologous end joining protein LigD
LTNGLPICNSSGICIDWTLHHITLVPSIPFIRPAAPILAHQPSAGPDWIHEIKWDGWRCQIVKSGGEVRVYTRNGNDWSAQLPAIVRAARELKARSFSMDGELIASSQGFDFYTIPQSIHRQQVVVIAFDLLFLNLRDLRRLALDSRREALVKLISGSQDLIQLSEAFEDGNELLAAAEEYGLEGIVSKRRDLPYRSGRCPYWLKIKTARWREASKNRYKRSERNR